MRSSNLAPLGKIPRGLCRIFIKYHEAYSFRWVSTFNSDRVPWSKFRYFGCSLREESFQITLYLPQWQNIINSDNFSEVNTEYGEVRFPVQILCFMMMLNIIKIWKRWKILRFYEFTRAEGYLGSSNSNFIVIVIASSVWILVQWFNGSNKKEELSWDKTKTKTKSRYSPPQPLKKQKPLTSTLTEEEDEQFGNCILRLNTLLAIVLQIVQQNLMFRKLRCEDVRDDEPQSKSMWEFFILVNYHKQLNLVHW